MELSDGIGAELHSPFARWRGCKCSTGEQGGQYRVMRAEDRAEIRVLENTLKALIQEKVRNTGVTNEQQILRASLAENSFYV